MKTGALSRRMFLRGSGVVLALPWLEAMCTGAASAAAPPRRMVAIQTGLGMHAENLFPAAPGRDYALTPYLEQLKDHRDQFTLFGGLSHPDVDGGHASEVSFLTAATHPGLGGFKNTISLDQYVVEKLAPDTRFPHLSLSTNGSKSNSFTRSGVMIPAENRPSAVFKALFVDGTEKEIANQVARLEEGRSIMDGVMEEARDLQKSLGAKDQDRLDEYFTSVREVEKRLKQNQAWATRPKPHVDAQPPKDVPDATDIIARTHLVFELVRLALQTDSTRVITITLIGGGGIPPIPGVKMDWHNLSHHGKDPQKLAQLRLIEVAQMKAFSDMVADLRNTPEAGGTLLDRTMILYGSNLGNASSHDTKNLPILLAGGGFKHGQYLAFDSQRNTALGKLFVTMLQRLGVETDTFASGKGTLAGLEMA